VSKKLARDVYTEQQQQQHRTLLNEILFNPVKTAVLLLHANALQHLGAFKRKKKMYINILKTIKHPQTR
jgi:hypothetical protein